MRETKYSYYQHKYSKSLISPPFTLQFENCTVPPRPAHKQTEPTGATTPKMTAAAGSQLLWLFTLPTPQGTCWCSRTPAGW